MSLSSRKSERGYNRSASRIASCELITQQQDGNYIDEHDLDSYMRCGCSDCNYDMGRNYMAALVWKLEKLSLLSKDAVRNFWNNY